MTDHLWTYRLTLDDDGDQDVARFIYADAPGPEADDTRLLLNRPSWEKAGRPDRVTITIRIVG